MFYRSYQKGGRPNASVPYEMPRQKADEGRQGHNYEEWKASDSGCVPRMWDQDVQDWKGLIFGITVTGIRTTKGRVFLYRNTRPLY